MTILTRDFDAIEWIRAELARRPALLGSTQVVLIDGPSGAGKTRFAELLAPRIDAEVIHTDDLLDGWDDQFTYWERLEEHVLLPIGAGEPGSYRQYDWDAGQFGQRIEVKPPSILIVEGVGAARAQARPLATLTVFITAPREVREARSLGRDGLAMQKRLCEWRRREDLHFGADATAWLADLTLVSVT